MRFPVALRARRPWWCRPSTFQLFSRVGRGVSLRVPGEGCRRVHFHQGHGPFAHLLRSAHFLLFSFLVSDSSVYILHRSPLSEIHVNIVSVWLAVSSSQQ